MDETAGAFFVFVLLGLIIVIFIAFAIFDYFDTRALKKKKQEMLSELKKRRNQVYVFETKKSMSAKSYYCPYCLAKLNPTLSRRRLNPNYSIYVFDSDNTCPNCRNTICWDNVMNMFDRKVRIVKGNRGYEHNLHKNVI